MKPNVPAPLAPESEEQQNGGGVATATAAPAESKYDRIENVGFVGYVPIDQIEVGDIALRPAQVESESFQGLKNSIAAEGIFQNLIVKHSDTTPNMYMLIDGLQRLTAAQMLGMSEVNVKVDRADEAKTHSIQIQANLHRVDTKPAQFGASIRRLMALRPDVTVIDLANELNVSPTYIYDRINLKNLVPEIADQVDAGEITAGAAIQLSKLPAEEQVNYVSRAVSLPINELVEQVGARVTEIKNATKEGRKTEPEKFTPIPRQRSKSDLEKEYNNHSARATFVTEGMSAPDAWDAAIAWALQLDPASVEVEREKWESDKKAREARAAAREAAREEKKGEKGSKMENAAAAAVAAAAVPTE